MPEDASSPSETPVSQMFTCLREVGSNLAFIRQELPGLEMPEDERRRLLETCTSFAEEVQRLRVETVQLQGASQQGPSAIEAVRERIRGQVSKLDDWVKAARSLAAAEPGCTVVKVLIEESGANMLRAYMGMWDCLEHLGAKA